MKKIIYIGLIMTVVFFEKTIAQDSLYINNSPAFYLQFFGPEILGIHFNMNAGRKFSVNAGIGGNVDYHLGMNYYFGNRSVSKSSLYAGIQICSLREINIFGSSGDYERQAGFYIPIGYEYVAKKGFSIQIDAGPNFVKDDWEQGNTYPFLGSIKVGYVIRAKKL